MPKRIAEPIGNDRGTYGMRSSAMLWAVLLLVGCEASVAPSTSVGPQADAWIPATDAVVEAFADHEVVAIGEIHGSRDIHAFFQALLADPRLVAVMNDVAVEFGSARHQATIDRYVDGDDVPEADLELVWTDTTQRSGVWNSPVYRALFEQIREVNADRRPEARIRVLLGDPPIVWEDVTDTTECDDRDPRCLDHWLFQRDRHFAEVVRDESLARGRRVLVIAGVGHIRRNPGATMGLSLTDELDATHPGATWAMVPVDAATRRGLIEDFGEPLPTFAVAVLLCDARLADIPAAELFDRGTVNCDNPPCEEPNAPVERLGDVADALLVP